MPIHDWSRVEAGIFHDFHHEWISEIKRSLNRGILPADHYALAEQFAGDFGPDVLTLQGPKSRLEEMGLEVQGGVALAEVEPRVSFRASAEEDLYARKAKQVVIHHVTDHRVVAVIELVSPGNKSSRAAVRDFAEKAAGLLRGGIHLLVADLFPPTVRDKQGIHKVIWSEFVDDPDFSLPPGRPLTLASYAAGLTKQAFVEPVAVGKPLPNMPLFLTSQVYVEVPLEATYLAAWEAVPAVWQKALM